MKSQTERIAEILARDGRVTRNQCLSMMPAITRLSARIKDLEDAGWEFDTRAEQGDYIYKLRSRPVPKLASSSRN